MIVPCAYWKTFRLKSPYRLRVSTSASELKTDCRKAAKGRVSIFMHENAKYVFIASMDIDADKEAVFNEVYDTEHIPLILKVPGVLSARRYVAEPLRMIMGGERKTIVAEGEPRYSAIYELESAEVLLSEAWAKAVDAGRWPSEVRPYTRNRRHTLRKVL